jgi:hypothetical protein
MRASEQAYMFLGLSARPVIARHGDIAILAGCSGRMRKQSTVIPLPREAASSLPIACTRQTTWQ